MAIPTDDVEEDVLRYVKEVLEIIMDVYPSCEESTLEDVLELIENDLNVFILAVDDAVTTPVFSSLRLLVQLMTEDRDGRHFSLGGRPRVSLEKDQLEFLIEQGFRVSDISNMFNCSRRTVERLMSMEYLLTDIAL